MEGFKGNEGKRRGSIDPSLLAGIGVVAATKAEIEAKKFRALQVGIAAVSSSIRVELTANQTPHELLHPSTVTAVMPTTSAEGGLHA